MNQFWNIGAALLVGLGAAAVGAQPSSGASIYTCIDAQGRRITSDRPIIECLDREQRELSPTGMTRRKIGPSLTEQERAALEAQRRKDAEEQSRLLEERRRDRALLARYPNQAAHDAERAAALAQVDEVSAIARKRLQELLQERKALDTEMEFYQKDPSKAPLKLRHQLAENQDETAAQWRFIANQEQEKRRIQQRFDAELAHLRQLWDSQRQLPAAAAPVQPPLPANGLPPAAR